MKYDIVISINVHEKPEYLMKQIKNINEYVSLKKKIILNCNDFMFEEMSDRNIPDVDVFPEPLNKKPFHGSLMHGIACNMSHALNNYNFDYFLVMSSREFFCKELTSTSQILKHIVDQRSAKSTDVDFGEPNFYPAGNYCKNRGNFHVEWFEHSKLPERVLLKGDAANMWWWPKFSCTKLYQYIEKNNMSFAHSMHEGVCFAYDTCESIISFFGDNQDIMNELFTFDGCVEEFALQSLASNYDGFYYIGNGCDTKNLDEVDPTKFTYKRER